MRVPPALPSQADRPFGVPPDIVLDLPPPLSVNRLRKVDWVNRKLAKRWREQADRLVMAQKVRTHNPVKFNKIARFEVLIVISEELSGNDLDNSSKCIIDYLHLIEIVEDDAPKNMRRVIVEWGEAREGCRVTVRPIA